MVIEKEPFFVVYYWTVELIYFILAIFELPNTEMEILDIIRILLLFYLTTTAITTGKVLSPLALLIHCSEETLRF
jgi:hypothetical protein